LIFGDVMNVGDTLKKFLSVHGISGLEDNVATLMKKELKGKVKKIYEDKVGNVISVKGSGKLKVLLTAHMDEVGLVVSDIGNDGFIRFAPVGGVDPKILPSRQVKIHTEKGVVNGVIATKTVHVQKKEELEKAYEIKDLFIDVGADDKKSVEKLGINIGDFIEFSEKFIDLHGRRISGRCLDNRVGCTVLTEVMKSINPRNLTVYGVGTVQEEIGLKGARGPMFGIDSDVIVSIDVEISGDTPFLKDEHIPLKLDRGPVIGIRDSSYTIDKRLKKLFLDAAKKYKIPYQLGVSTAGTTESTLAILTKDGKPGALIGVPVRYMHSTVEVVDLNDIENTVKLVVKALGNINKYFR